MICGLRRWQAGVLAGCMAFSLLPLLLVERLPMQDYPQHQLMAHVLTHLDDPATDFARYYESNFGFRPYLGFYGVAWLLAPVLSVDTAGRLCVALYLLATPLTLLGYLREVSPARAPAVLLVPALLFSSHYYLGFLNFLMALPGVFAALWALLRFTRSPSGAAGLGYVAAAGWVYLCHVTAFGTTMIVSALIALLAGRRRRHALGLVGLVGLAALVVTPWPQPRGGELRFEFLEFGEYLPPQGSGRPFYFISPITDLLYLLSYLGRDSSMGDAALYGLPLGAILVAAARYRRRGTEERPRRERWLLPLTGLALLFAVPGSTPEIDTVNMKFSAFLFLALPSLVPARWLDRRTLVVFALFAGATVSYSAVTHLRFDAEAAEFDPVLAAIPPGSSVYPMMLLPNSDVFLWTAPYVHFGYYVPLRKGGLGAQIFEGPQLPVRMTAMGYPPVYHYLFRPWLMDDIVLERMPHFVLLRASDRQVAIVPEPYRVVAESGPFRLLAPQAETH